MANNQKYYWSGMVLKTRLAEGFVVVILMGIAGILFGVSPNSKPQPSAKSPVRQEVLAKAIEYLGVDSTDKSAQNATAELKRADVERETFPFVHNRLISDSVWHVTFTNVHVESIREPIERDFTLYLDPVDGSLLRIYSVSDEVGSSDTLPKLPVEKSEIYFRKNKFPFAGISNYIPDVNFIQALDSCPLDPASTKEIEGYFIDHISERGIEDDFWFIVIRGSELLMPISHMAKDGDIPDNQRNGTMCRVNAYSGRLLDLSSLPREIRP